MPSWVWEPIAGEHTSEKPICKTVSGYFGIVGFHFLARHLGNNMFFGMLGKSPELAKKPLPF